METIRLAEGRSLAVEQAGDPNGFPILVHNGAPSSRLLYRRHTSFAAREGLRLISYDRPGYGGSTRQPGRTMADCAADVRVIAKHLGIQRLGVLGFSMGGPHALATAAQLPALITGAAVLASSAPHGAPGLEYGSDEIRKQYQEEKEQDLGDPEAARAEFKRAREQMLQRTPAAALEWWRTRANPAELDALQLDFAEYRVAAYQSGLQPGAEGWMDDEIAYFSPWGFDLSAIHVPVLLWHGRFDQQSPFQHSEWLAKAIPGAELRISDDGHGSLFVRGWDQALTWLREHA